MQPAAAAAWTSALLALYAAGMCMNVQPAASAHAAAALRPPARRTRSVSADRWLNLLSEYARSAGGAGAGAHADSAPWFPQPVPFELRLGGEEGARGASVPMLVLPVPVPMRRPGAAAECALNTNTGANSATSATSTTSAGSGTSTTSAGAATRSTAAGNFPPTKGEAPAEPPRAPRPPPSPLRTVPRLNPVDNSGHLIELFRAQVPSDPHLPPVVIQPDLGDDIDVEMVGDEEERPAPGELIRAARGASFYGRDGPRRRRCRRPARFRGPYEDLLAADDALGNKDRPTLSRTLRAAPPPPRFERPMRVRARLTVPRADYTETYSVWWDPASGASRIDFHGGTASAYRVVRRDGTVQSILVRVDRTGAQDVRRCTVAPPRRLQPTERAMPALPDLRRFSFDGYVENSAERVERWSYTLEGRAGEVGGARGEALTFRHELRVARAADNYTTVPIRYSVSVDSSVLGPDSDGYVHVYTETDSMAHDSAMLRLDIADACEFVVSTDRLERVEPLREFVMLRRDPRYDDALDRYKTRYERRYADDSEEAVRKNLLIQSYRFVESGNREGATFVLGTNYLSDRLMEERRALLGAVRTASSFDTMPFPHTAEEMTAQLNRLPYHFDWRQLGAVTPVRSQLLHECRSCWAFAVVGAVEGALAINTGRIVPLSEQTLVDCGHPQYGTNGCNGSWPENAYEYVRERGLPALRDYPKYSGEVEECEAQRAPVVTRISGYVRVNNVTSSNLVVLKTSIRRHGPIVAVIDGQADSFVYYKKGYYYDDRCVKTKPNHVVLLVGWSTYRQHTYLIVKNSWSTGWGDGGYMMMRASGNTCGVQRHLSYPVVRDADVSSVPASARAIVFAPSAPAADL